MASALLFFWKEKQTKELCAKLRFAAGPFSVYSVGRDDPARRLGGHRGFRRLRAATYFAHGGSSSQSPLVSVSAWRRKLRPLPCSSSSRRTRFAGLRREGREISQNAAGDGSR